MKTITPMISSYKIFDCSKFNISSSKTNQKSYKTKDKSVIEKSDDDLFILEKIRKPLHYLTIHLSKDPIVFTHVCRVLSIISKRSSNSSQKEKIMETIEELLQAVILPALSMFPSNYSFANDVWEILSVYNINTRYKLYG